MDVRQLLKQLGFGEYEAKAYVALLASGPSNGYELAKAAALPRANVYAVLKRLVARGAARRFQTPDGTRYAATAAADLLAQLDREHQHTLDAAREALAALATPTAALPVFSIDGADELLAEARATIDRARDTLLVAIQPAEAAVLAEPLRHAAERGVKVTTLCLEACECECGGCQGEIHRMQLAPANGARWLLLVADQKSALVGQADERKVEGMLTERPLIVEVVAAYIRQSLALALLGSELAGRFEGLLSRQARELLGEVCPNEAFPVLITNSGDAPAV